MQIKGKGKIKPKPHTSSRFYFQVVKAITLKMKIFWDLTVVGLIALGKGSYTHIKCTISGSDASSGYCQQNQS